MLTGEQVYEQVCKTCHEAGLAGAPKFGDKAAWGKVSRKARRRRSSTRSRASSAMPPEGGNTDLTDDEVQRAVVFMANKAGANWKEPAGGRDRCRGGTRRAPPRRGGTCRCARRQPRRCRRAAAARRAPPQRDGKKIYETTCVVMPRRGNRGRAEIRRQGGVGARASGKACSAVRHRAPRQGRDAAEGRQRWRCPTRT